MMATVYSFLAAIGLAALTIAALAAALWLDRLATDRAIRKARHRACMIVHGQPKRPKR